MITIALALVVTAATWAIGWWAVVPVALVTGWFLREVPTIAAWTALGGALGWALLLAIDALFGRLGALGHVLSRTVDLPMAALVVLTLAIPAVLGWSAATLAAAAGDWLGRRLDDAAAPPA